MGNVEVHDMLQTCQSVSVQERVRGGSGGIGGGLHFLAELMLVCVLTPVSGA